jgi:hypothetical protein
MVGDPIGCGEVWLHHEDPAALGSAGRSTKASVLA